MAAGSPICKSHPRSGWQWRQVADVRQGFYARPVKGEDGTLNMMIWECGIPGKAGVSVSQPPRQLLVRVRPAKPAPVVTLH
jgi:hypothetical protein